MNKGAPASITIDVEILDAVKELARQKGYSAGRAWGIEHERKMAVQAVLHLIEAIKFIKGKPTRSDLVQLAKRIKRGYGAPPYDGGSEK